MIGGMAFARVSAVTGHFFLMVDVHKIVVMYHDILGWQTRYEIFYHSYFGIKGIVSGENS